jgi:hypothetical protein
MIRLPAHVAAAAFVLVLHSCTTPEEASMSISTPTSNLLVRGDLEDMSRTRGLAKSDLDALRAVSDRIEAFMARPHPDLGRPGPVCPFVPPALERKTLWLAAEHVADRSASDLLPVIEGYKRAFLRAEPTDGDDAKYRALVIVLPDLPASGAKDFFGELLGHLAVPSYVTDGLVMGGFYEGNQGAAIYNAGFRPFTSPVPFLLMRPAVLTDWKFFLENEEWLGRWARRYGESAVVALADELRRQPWRSRSD